MGVVPGHLAAQLRDRLGLRRAIETGTYQGASARELSGVFEEVITIEVDPVLAEAARRQLADLDRVEVVAGTSRTELPPRIDPARPTLYWLDGHWSGPGTGGNTDECPVLAEIAATARGSADDALLIDDARFFFASPQPPHDPTAWPEFAEIYDAVRAARPESYVTVVHDIVIAVPPRAKPDIDVFAHSSGPGSPLRRRLRRLALR